MAKEDLIEFSGTVGLESEFSIVDDFGARERCGIRSGSVGSGFRSVGSGLLGGGLRSIFLRGVLDECATIRTGESLRLRLSNHSRLNTLWVNGSVDRFGEILVYFKSLDEIAHG